MALRTKRVSVACTCRYLHQYGWVLGQARVCSCLRGSVRGPCACVLRYQGGKRDAQAEATGQVWQFPCGREDTERQPVWHVLEGGLCPHCPLPHRRRSGPYPTLTHISLSPETHDPTLRLNNWRGWLCPYSPPSPTPSQVLQVDELLSNVALVDFGFAVHFEPGPSGIKVRGLVGRGRVAGCGAAANITEATVVCSSRRRGGGPG